MKELTLQQLASWCGGKVAPEYEAIKVNGIQSDSRKVQPGELFLALRGERVDGHEYISAAKEKGAVAALVSQESGELPCIVVENTLRAYGEIARHYREMFSFKVIGITGYTGGKLKELCDISLHAPVMSMQVTEDIHMIFDHLMMSMFYKYLCGKDHLKK